MCIPNREPPWPDATHLGYLPRAVPTSFQPALGPECIDMAIGPWNQAAERLLLWVLVTVSFVQNQGCDGRVVAELRRGKSGL